MAQKLKIQESTLDRIETNAKGFARVSDEIEATSIFLTLRDYEAKSSRIEKKNKTQSATNSKIKESKRKNKFSTDGIQGMTLPLDLGVEKKSQENSLSVYQEKKQGAYIEDKEVELKENTSKKTKQKRKVKDDVVQSKALVTEQSVDCLIEQPSVLALASVMAEASLKLQKELPFEKEERDLIIKCCNAYKNTLPIYLRAYQEEIGLLEDIIKKCSKE